MLKLHTQKDKLNDLYCIFEGLSVEKNCTSLVCVLYLYPLNICWLYQQSLSSTKCYRATANFADCMFSGKGF